jgi:hypothetical protein
MRPASMRAPAGRWKHPCSDTSIILASGPVVVALAGVCVYVCMCVCVYVCVCVCKCVCIYMYVCMYVCIYICIYMYAYICKCVCVCVHIYLGLRRMYSRRQVVWNSAAGVGGVAATWGRGGDAGEQICGEQ